MQLCGTACRMHSVTKGPLASADVRSEVFEESERTQYLRGWVSIPSGRSKKKAKPRRKLCLNASPLSNGCTYTCTREHLVVSDHFLLGRRFPHIRIDYFSSCHAANKRHNHHCPGESRSAALRLVCDGNAGSSWFSMKFLLLVPSMNTAHDDLYSQFATPLLKTLLLLFSFPLIEESQPRRSLS